MGEQANPSVDQDEDWQHYQIQRQEEALEEDQAEVVRTSIFIFPKPVSTKIPDDSFTYSFLHLSNMKGKIKIAERVFKGKKKKKKKKKTGRVFKKKKKKKKKKKS